VDTLSHKGAMDGWQLRCSWRNDKSMALHSTYRHLPPRAPPVDSPKALLRLENSLANTGDWDVNHPPCPDTPRPTKRGSSVTDADKTNLKELKE